ncbi:MAG: fluoride efflux transporter CrcB [Sphaerochaetaceae bacterium]|nr:fluoride efflux transporter CrcB [Sphaerochaetaceae bacterium]MDD3163781.1 fluoride efflux transporter CrcB [Sphaerochaetaceae bacterium]MDD4007834.1 fluoride efflux transporter CrcB [Sphaerochaetaceae bacterium]MDD4397302.1 fluoride efflux transporter CrcB [Sphaerochaetaceae bacterium]
MNLFISCIFIGLGGAAGAILRYLFGLLPFRNPSGFPLTTLAINVIGAFIIGLVVALAQKNPLLSPNLILFLKVGVCGGFTTFSTFSLETFKLLESGNPWIAISYIASSVVLCVLAVYNALKLAS